MKICSQGLVRPYDPVINAKKIADAKVEYPDLDFDMCCPHSTEVRDVGDLKPYIMAAAREIAAELELGVIVADKNRKW